MPAFTNARSVVGTRIIATKPHRRLSISNR
jgi:hypothetical protein